MTAIEQQKAAQGFSDFWQGKGYEKGESQTFWLTLLNQVFGVEHPEQFIHFEQQVQLDHTSFVDAHIPETKVMIEQKSLGRNLGEGIRQSDGSLLNPFQQAKRYADSLPNSQRPRWIVTCNFAEWWVYDLEHPNDDPQKIALANLGREYDRLRFLVDLGNEHIKQEEKVSKEAGKLVGLIYDALLKQYLNPDSPDTLRSLNILCVRLVFCLYAEDAHLFGSKTAFHDYLAQYPAKDIRRALIDLFEVLDTPINQRDPYLDDTLKAFPYVNGGLFSRRNASVPTRETIIIPQFTEELKELILTDASDNFDWNEISPTIFGAIFESTLNPDTRRSGGMHYTSIANIHKVIDPLFLDELKDEFAAIKAIAQEKQRLQKLDAFQDKLASLTFFDPACGSGNFLTESYVSLRRLENEIIRLRHNGQVVMGEFANPVKVDIHQFYGIEINDFAVSVATTALWIAEQQMLQETAKLVQFNIEPLPLKAYHNIKEGNALRMDWKEVFEQPESNQRESNQRESNQPILADTFLYPDYIMGNPPFVGYSLQSKEQKEDMLSIYVDEKGKPYKTAGKIDYVAAWYWKTAELMHGLRSSMPAKQIKAALVSTNSITQGEQVAAIWQPLFERFGIQIDFAYRTFRWDSEADIKAHVHCVIVGFSVSDNKAKRIYLSDMQSIPASNINAYLMDAPDVWIESRNKPLCNVPEMTTGNRPADGGHLIIEAEDYEEFIRKEPAAIPFIKKLTGAQEYINNKPRYCLWLKGISPAELRKMPLVMERVQACREDRLQGAPDRQKLADTPWLFREIRNPDSYIIVPATSSEQRRYIPLGFMNRDTIPTNSAVIIPSATLYHFGVLTSNVHMAWMRVVCGRLKSDYRYSKDIVYNNFPWPSLHSPSKLEGAGGVCQNTPIQSPPPYPLPAGGAGECVKRIEQTAQAILDARAKYPDCSLADLYDEITMPPELRKAHQDNDRAVMSAYGFSTKMTESECVAELFKLYEKLKSAKIG